MRLKSQKGYSLVEVGVGLVLIGIFMVCGVTMLKGTYNTYRLVEQKNMVMSYLIRAIEIELLDDESMTITDDANDTTLIESNLPLRKVEVTKVPNTNIVITTTLEALETKNGVAYYNSKVKKLTATADFYIRKDDESSKRSLTLTTLKVEGGGEDA